MYSKKINQLATNLNPQSTDLIPIGDAETGQLKTTTFNNISGVSSDGVISGGIVTWTGIGLNFNISACVYYINGIRYTSPASTKTLAAADNTYDRIDVFAVNTSGQVVVVQGTPALNPIEPEGDTQTTLGLTNVTIAANATTPSGVTREIIYDENLSSPTEWAKTATISGGTYNSGDTAFANTFTKSYLVTLTSGGVRAFSSAFVRPTEGTITDFKSLSFAIRLTTAVPSGTAINISFWNGTTIVTNKYSLSINNTVGFNRTLINTWQPITIPLDGSLLKFTNNKFTRFIFEIVGPGLTLRFDTLCLNSGIKNPTGGGTTATNSFGFVNGSSGTATAAQATDTLTVVGTGLATTSATGKTLTIAVPTPIPTQTGNNGKFLTTDGSNVSWGSPTDTGITNLNSQTGTTQTFATGTSGTDFGISSATNTHTFNLPTASATNRGALSSADWSTFNSKFDLPSLTNGSVLFSNGTTIAQDNANFFWDDSTNKLGIGTNNPSVEINISKNQNAATGIDISNTTSNTAAQARLLLTSDGSSGSANIGKYSTGTTPLKIIAAKDFTIYNGNTAGDISILNDFASGTIKLASGGSSTSQLVLKTTGQLQLNNYTTTTSFTGTEAGYLAFDSSGNIITTAAPTSSNIYNTNGTLTSDRTLTHGGFNLSLLGSSFTNRFTSAGRLLIGTTTEDASAILRVDSTVSGFLPPRMTTTQRNAISSPATGLQIYNTTTNTNDFYNGTAWAVNGANIYNTDGTLTANRTLQVSTFYMDFQAPSGNMRFTTNGKVLIGTGTEVTAERLTVNGVGGFTGLNVSGGANILGTAIKLGNFSDVTCTFTSSTDVIIGAAKAADSVITGAVQGDGVLRYASTKSLLIGISTTAHAKIFGSTGNLVIQNGGTFQDAGYKLDVTGTARFTDNFTISNNRNAVTGQTISNTTSGTASQVQILFTSSAGSANIAKYSATTTGLKIIAANDFIVYNGNGAGDIAVLNDFTTGKIKFAAGGSSTAQMTIQANGEVIVGGTTDNGAYNLQCNGTGVWGAGAYVNGSDIRLKENIKPIISGLDYVSKMNPISYNYLKSYSKDQNIQPGFIAQELKEVFKDEEWVNGIVYEDSEFMNVAYQNLIPILTKAIQELKQEIEILKNK